MNLFGDICYTSPEVLRTFTNLKITNGKGFCFATNTSVFLSMCPTYITALLSPQFEGDDHATIILPWFDGVSIEKLNQLMHYGAMEFDPVDHEVHAEVRQVRADLEAMCVFLPDEFWGFAGGRTGGKVVTVASVLEEITAHRKRKVSENDVTESEAEQDVDGDEVDPEPVTQRNLDDIDSWESPSFVATSNGFMPPLYETFEAPYGTTKAMKRAKYICPYNYCEKEYRERRDYKQHLLRHKHGNVEDARWTCTICSKTFKTRAKMKEHRRYDHIVRPDADLLMAANDEIPFEPKTEIIEDVWNDNSLDYDNLSEDPEFKPKDPKAKKANWACMICDITFKTKGQLKEHRKLMHSQSAPPAVKKETPESDDDNGSSNDVNCDFDIDPYKQPDGKYRCPKCPMEYKGGRDFRQHVLRHDRPDKEERWTCTVCDMTFKRRAQMKEHRRIAHTDIMLKCPYCEKVFHGVNRKKYQRHVDLHQNQCVACGKSYGVMGPLQVAKQVDTHRRSMGPFHDNFCTYPTCPGVAFETWDERVQHVQKVHEGIFQYKCGHCQRVFDTDPALGSHLRNDHRDENQEKVVCDFCGMPFAKSSLAAHLRTHEKIEDIPCQICGKVFDNKGSLQQHVWRHKRLAKEKESKCQFCGKTFQQRKNLRLHVLDQHTSEDQKPAHCEICGKGFARHYKMRLHMKAHENKREFKCRICGAGFNNSHNRHQHEKCVHKGSHVEGGQ